MMCTPLRSPKIYGFILGFQRWVWWPKCAPASSNCCIVTTVVAIGLLLPVLPRRSHVTDLAAGTGYVSSVCGMRGPLAEAVRAFKGLATVRRSGLTHENKEGTILRLSPSALEPLEQSGSETVQRSQEG